MHPRFRPLLLTCIFLSPGLSHAADKPADGPVTLRLLSASGFIGAAAAIARDYEKKPAQSICRSSKRHPLVRRWQMLFSKNQAPKVLTL